MSFTWLAAMEVLSKNRPQNQIGGDTIIFTIIAIIR